MPVTDSGTNLNSWTWDKKWQSNAWRDGKRRILSKVKESTNKLVKWMTGLTIHYIHSVQYRWEQGLPWKDYSLSLPNRLCLDYYQVFVVCGCDYNNSILAYLLLIISREVLIKLSNKLSYSTILVINNGKIFNFSKSYLWTSWFTWPTLSTVLLYLYLTTVLMTTHKLRLESNKSWVITLYQMVVFSQSACLPMEDKM